MNEKTPYEQDLEKAAGVVKQFEDAVTINPNPADDQATPTAKEPSPSAKPVTRNWLQVLGHVLAGTSRMSPQVFARGKRGRLGGRVNLQVSQKDLQKPVVPEVFGERNKPCPCGSGAKWKRCHGKPKEAMGTVFVSKEEVAKMDITCGNARGE